MCVLVYQFSSLQALVVEDLHPEILASVLNPNESALSLYGDNYINTTDKHATDAVYHYAKANLAKVNLFLKV